MIRHVIFDLDGTLVDSCATCVAVLSDMLSERGDARVIDPVEARGYMSKGGADMVAALLGSACVDPASDLADFRARYHRRHTPIAALFPGVARGLARLRDAGLTLSICSNKPQGLCDKVLADTGLAEHFAVVVGGRDDLRPKPAPDLLLAVLAQLDGALDQCCYVGDSELDHRVAADAGIPFHFVSWGYAGPGWHPPGCATFGCFDAMTDAILPKATTIHA